MVGVKILNYIPSSGALFEKNVIILEKGPVPANSN